MFKRPLPSPYPAPAAKAPRADLSSTMETVLRYERRGLLDASKLDDAAVASLHSLGPAGVVRALEKLCQYDLPSVDNHSALLKDIVVAESEALANVEHRPGTVASSAPPQGNGKADNLLLEYHKAGILDINVFDPPVQRDLEALPHDEAEQVLKVYLESDRSNVSNHSSFLKTIIKLTRKLPDFVTRGWELDAAVNDKLDEAITEGCLAPEECDAMLRVSLSTLPPADAVKVLDDFTNVVKSDPDAIHCRPGFLAGMLRRFRQAAEVTDRSSKSVGDLVEQYCNSGQVSREVVEECTKELEMMPPGGAGQALEEFANSDLTNIRKPSSYFRGIIRKIRRLGVSLAPSPVPILTKRPPIIPATHRQDRPVPAQTPRAAFSAPAAAAPIPAAVPVAHAPHPPIDASILDLLARHRDAGLIADGDLDRGCVMELEKLGTTHAEEVLAEFFQHDIHALRNKSSFLMGLIKRSKQAPAPPPPAQHAVAMGRPDTHHRQPVVTAHRPVAAHAPPPPPQNRFVEPYRDPVAPPPYGEMARAPRHHQPPPPQPAPYGGAPPRHRPEEVRGAGLGRGKGPFNPGPPPARAYAPQTRPPAIPSVTEEKIFCPACGVQQPTVNFCVKCGFALTKFLEGVSV